MKLEIQLKKGIGELLFNSTIEEVMKQIGSAEEVEDIGEDIEYPTTILHYHDLGFSLFFDNNDNSRLTCIDIDSDEVEIFGKKLIGSSPREVELLMIENNIYNETKEAEDWGEMRISFEEYSVDFYFIDEKLVSITFGK
ncbi:MAG: hypothetical protein KA273_00500 [Bacteroidales bacterium]|nr:hypothetical protein [Bacteroidales bacterium]